MHRWKGTILEAVAKCWVTLVDSGAANEDALELRQALREVCVELARATPTVLDDYGTLLALDAPIFDDLVGSLNASTAVNIS